MKFQKGQRVKIVANRSHHGFRLGEIVEIRTTEPRVDTISAYHIGHKRDQHGPDWWWVKVTDVAPITVKAVVL